jgi:hypothetical protein
MYPCPKLSAWWVMYKVNPREPLPNPSDSCYHACNLEDKENYGIVQEDDLPTSSNVEISEGLDSLVEDPNDVEEVVTKRKQVLARKKKRRKIKILSLWGQGDNLILILMIIDKYVCFIFCSFYIMFLSYFLNSFQY